MGIFSADKDTDVQTISRIANASINGYAAEIRRLGIQSGIEASICPSCDFEYISNVGGEIVNEFFEHSTALHRVAILLVLSNAFHVFSLRKNGKLLLNVEERKIFLSRFTCLYVHAGLTVFPWRNEADDRVYCMKWNGFPSEDFQKQFLTYLQWTPTAKISTHPTTAKKDGSTKVLAQLSLGCAMLLEFCVAPEMLPPASTPPKLGE